MREERRGGERREKEKWRRRGGKERWKEAGFYGQLARKKSK